MAITPPAAGKMYGKILIGTVTSSQPLPEGCAIEFENIRLKATEVWYNSAGRVINVIPYRPGSEGRQRWTTSDPYTTIFNDNPGWFIKEGELWLPNCKRVLTVEYRTDIYLVCPGKPDELIGSFKWGFTLTIEYGPDGKVANSTVVPTPVK
jgi:hypothetical protein